MPFPSLGDLPDPGIEPGSPALQADALPSEPPRNLKGKLITKGKKSMKERKGRFKELNGRGWENGYMYMFG